jgi:hypothetical protein
MFCLTVEIACKCTTEGPHPVGSGFSLCASNSSFELPQPQHTPPTMTNSYYLGVSVVMVVRCMHLREWCGNCAFFQFLKTTSSMTKSFWKRHRPWHVHQMLIDVHRKTPKQYGLVRLLVDSRFVLLWGYRSGLASIQYFNGVTMECSDSLQWWVEFSATSFSAL